MTIESRNRAIYVITDYVMGVAAMLLFNIVRYNYFVGDAWSSLSSFLMSRPVVTGIAILPALMLVVHYLSGYYVNVDRKSRIDEFFSTLISCFVGAIAIYFVVIVNDSIHDRDKVFEIIATLWMLMFGCTYAARLCITIFIVRRNFYKRVGYNTLVIGASQSAKRMADRLKRQSNGKEFNVIGYVSIDGEPSERSLDKPIYSIGELQEICERLNVKQLIALPHPEGVNATISMLATLFPTGCAIYISPLLFQLISGRSTFGNIAGEPLIDISRPDLPPTTLAWKRAGDLVLSSLALILLSPVMAAIALAVKLDSKGPVFYKQERIGLHKRKFNIIKFRSMATDAEAGGPALSTPNDPRITRVGHYLRKYRLDELPQFWNVVKGEMSLVGPRPEREYYVKQIVERVPYYTLVHGVRPGITSWGMVKYGYATEISQMLERLQYDLIYIENISMGVDLKIILYTIRTVITGKGV